MRNLDVLVIVYAFFKRHKIRFFITLAFVILLLTNILIINAVGENHILLLRKQEEEHFKKGISFNIDNSVDDIYKTLEDIQDLLAEGNHTYKVNKFIKTAKINTGKLNNNIDVSVISYTSQDFKASDNMQPKDGIYISKELYELANKYLGMTLDSLTSAELIFTNKSGYNKDSSEVNVSISGTLCGITEDSGYVMYAPLSMLASKREIVQNYKFLVNDNILKYNAQIKHYTSLNDKIKKVTTIIESSEVARIKKISVYNFGVRIFMIILSILQFSLCVVGLANSITISFNENNKTIALMRVVGMNNRNSAKVAKAEGVVILFIGMIISYIFAIILMPLGKYFSELLFGETSDMVVFWYLPLILFTLIATATSKKISKEFKKLNSDSLVALRSE